VQPIGVEIKLPERPSVAGTGPRGPALNSAGQSTVRDAPQLVPVRPLSAIDAATGPQAQLGAPMPVD
jgi:hypothetical protein